MTMREQVLTRIRLCPGIVASTLAEELGTDDTTYGRYKQISLIVARLRKEGLIQDIDRCAHCGRPPRSHKPVPLFPVMKSE